MSSSRLEGLTQTNKRLWKELVRMTETVSPTKTTKLTHEQVTTLYEESPKGGQRGKVIRVYHEDPLTVALTAAAAHFRVVYLQLVKDNWPIDGVKNGNTGLDNDLLRRSTFYTGLQEEMYPLRSHELLWSPGVQVVRGGDGKRLPQPLSLHVISFVTLSRPSIMTLKTGTGIEEQYENDREESLLRAKIRACLQLVAAKGYSGVVLGDLGCQAEGNPISRVVAICNEEIAASPLRYFFFGVKTQPAFDQRPVKTEKDKLFLQFHEGINRAPEPEPAPDEEPDEEPSDDLDTAEAMRAAALEAMMSDDL